MFDHLVGWAVSIGTVVAAVVITLAFLTSDIRAKRSLRKLAITRVADVRDGQRVKLIGVIRDRETLVSPNRNATCIYYHAWHEELKAGARRGVGWVAVGEEHHGCDFVLADDSGEVRVDASTLVGMLAHGSYIAIEGAAPHTRGREAIIIPGQRVAVIGTASFEPAAGDEHALYRDGAARIVIRSDGATPVIVSDDPSIVP
jgi:hypothetical protein